MENLFDTLCSALLEPEIKKLFHEAEGVDLMLIMMKCVRIFLYCRAYTHPEFSQYREKLLARSRAIKVLDHALAESSGTANCETFVVEAGGLKTLFAAFMGKVFIHFVAPVFIVSHPFRLAAIQKAKSKPFGTRVGRNLTYSGYHRVALHQFGF